MTANPYIRYDSPKEGANDSTPLENHNLEQLYARVEKDTRDTARINRRVGKRLKNLSVHIAHE